MTIDKDLGLNIEQPVAPAAGQSQIGNVPDDRELANVLGMTPNQLDTALEIISKEESAKARRNKGNSTKDKTEPELTPEEKAEMLMFEREEAEKAEFKRAYENRYSNLLRYFGEDISNYVNSMLIPQKRFRDTVRAFAENMPEPEEYLNHLFRDIAFAIGALRQMEINEQSFNPKYRMGDKQITDALTRHVDRHYGIAVKTGYIQDMQKQAAFKIS